MRGLFIHIGLILLMGFCSIAMAGGNSGGQPGNFRDLALGGRPSAMGGAYCAVATGGIGHLYNPAGAAQSRRRDVSFSYRVMKLDRRLGWANLTLPAREYSALSISWLFTGTAKLESRDQQGNIIAGEDFSSSENMLGFNFAKQFSRILILGGKAYYLQHSIAGISAYTVGIDVGGLARIDMKSTAVAEYLPLIQTGLSVENIGASYRWTTNEFWQGRGYDRGASIDEKIPTTFRGGTAFIRPGRYLLAIDAEINTLSRFRTHVGGEYLFYKMMALRAGLDDSRPTFGLGLTKELKRFVATIDISYLTDKVGEGDDFMVSFDFVF